jgi:hypothetical protein
MCFIFPNHGQKNVEIPEGKYPYHSIYEWPSVGAFLLNSDPDKLARDMNILLVNTEGEIQWQETFYPKSHDPKLILSDNSSYLYFIDDLELDGNKLHYHQISKGGSVRSTSIDFLTTFKKFGIYDPADAQLEDVINTEPALIFQFSFENKSTEKLDHILLFLTHHNHKQYAIKALETPLDFIKKGISGHLHFAGSDSQKMYFSNFQKTGSRNTLVFHGFSPKAEADAPQELILDAESISAKNQQFGYFGHIYDTPKNREMARGVYFDQTFYAFHLNNKTRAFDINTYDNKGNLISLIQNFKSAEEKRKYDGTIFFRTLGDQLFVSAIINEMSTSYKLQEGEAKRIDFQAEESFKNLNANPSRLFNYREIQSFVLPTTTGILIFDESQLNKKAGLKFINKE